MLAFRLRIFSPPSEQPFDVRYLHLVLLFEGSPKTPHLADLKCARSWGSCCRSPSNTQPSKNTALAPQRSDFLRSIPKKPSKTKCQHSIILPLEKYPPKKRRDINIHSVATLCNFAKTPSPCLKVTGIIKPQCPTKNRGSNAPTFASSHPIGGLLNHTEPLTSWPTRVPSIERFQDLFLRGNLLPQKKLPSDLFLGKEDDLDVQFHHNQSISEWISLHAAFFIQWMFAQCHMPLIEDI